MANETAAKKQQQQDPVIEKMTVAKPNLIARLPHGIARQEPCRLRSEQRSARCLRCRRSRLQSQPFAATRMADTLWQRMQFPAILPFLYPESLRDGRSENLLRRSGLRRR